MNRVSPLAALLAIGLLGGCSDDAPTTDAGPSTCGSDADCDDLIFCNGLEVCDPGAPDARADGCRPPAAPACATPDVCDETLDECVADCVDADGDGAAALSCGGSDCDDGDPDRYPTNQEICDTEGRDEDCDPSTFGDKDQDDDGAIDAICCNGDQCGTDCDDTRAEVRPGATEACNGLDDDCDGDVDEGVAIEGYVDRDRDLHGDPDSPMTACAGTVGFSALSDDCDDEDVAVHGAQVELCDGKDNDCNGNVDEASESATWYLDQDGDGFGHPAVTLESCEVQPGYSLLATDCDDLDESVSPIATELCNGRDDDCNGIADFRLGVNDFEDDDGDGFTDAACDPAGTDCADRDRTRYPGANESCEGRDNDCDGTVDESCSGAITCPAGTDPASAPDCEPVLCAANQRVLLHRCVPCPSGTTNAAGDDASGPGTRCDDVDECTMDLDDCEDMCIDVPGSFLCRCGEGFALGPDGTSCLTEVVFEEAGAGAQSFEVPAGVTEIDVELRGASGAATEMGTPLGGEGGIVRGRLPVTAGETLSVRIGQAATGGLGGWSGGGDASFGSLVDGGGGGGVTELRRGVTRLVVAGGGGGAGYPSGSGGDGGGASGGPGGGPGSEGGGGGTPTTGGTAGDGPITGTQGIVSGGGASAGSGSVWCGGAGGGGYTGGGSGAGTTGESGTAGGGGGGSSFVHASVIDPVLERGGNVGHGRAIIRY